ncbi:MAG: hypothetical protein IT322_20760 [Anaerolineae bacterium]|nr:hypothetical protein [Anaerolineae bacterium]
MLFQADMSLEDLEGLRNDLLKLENTLRQLADKASEAQWARLCANLEMAADRIERAVGILTARLEAKVRWGE